MVSLPRRSGREIASAARGRRSVSPQSNGRPFLRRMLQTAWHKRKGAKALSRKGEWSSHFFAPSGLCALALKRNVPWLDMDRLESRRYKKDQGAW